MQSAMPSAIFLIIALLLPNPICNQLQTSIPSTSDEIFLKQEIEDQSSDGLLYDPPTYIPDPTNKFDIPPSPTTPFPQAEEKHYGKQVSELTFILREVIQKSYSIVNFIKEVALETNLQERLIIAKDYKRLVGSDVVTDLIKDLGKNQLRLILVGLFSKREDFLAIELQRALEGSSLDEATLNEIVCCLKPTEMEDVLMSYQNQNNKTLRASLEENTSGMYLDLLNNLTNLNKPRKKDTIESPKFHHRVETTLIELQRGIPVNLCHHSMSESNKSVSVIDSFSSEEIIYDHNIRAFIKSFSRQSYEVIRKVADLFKQRHGMDLENCIGKTITENKDYRELLLSILSYSQNQTRFVAKNIFRGLNQNKSSVKTGFMNTLAGPLTRAIVLLSFPEIAILQDVFGEIYSTSLDNMVHAQIGTDYASTLSSIFTNAKEQQRKEFEHSG